MLLSFWEDPALLVGIPFVVLGGLGLLGALMALIRSGENATERPAVRGAGRQRQ